MIVISVPLVVCVCATVISATKMAYEATAAYDAKPCVRQHKAIFLISSNDDLIRRHVVLLTRDLDNVEDLDSVDDNHILHMLFRVLLGDTANA